MLRKKGKWILEKHSKVGWNDLHQDILVMIFERLDRKRLFQSAYPVCQWWRAVSRPMLFRRKAMLDFKGLKVKDVDDVPHFMNMLKLILDGLQLRAVSIFKFIFPRYLYLSDEHLWYLAQRLPKLQGVLLPCTTDMITPLGFSRAIQAWSELTTFGIGSINFSDYTYIIKEIGVRCKNFNFLYIDTNDMSTKKGSTFVLNGQTSLIIASYLPNLTSLGFSRCVLYKSALKNIMSKCKNLQELLMTECKRVKARDTSPEGKGYYLVNKMPSENDTVTWLTLLEGDQNAFLSTSSTVNLLWSYEGMSMFTVGVFD